MRTFTAQSLVGLLLYSLSSEFYCADFYCTIFGRTVNLWSDNTVQSLVGLFMYSPWSDYYCTVFGRTFTERPLEGHWLVINDLCLALLWSLVIDYQDSLSYSLTTDTGSGWMPRAWASSVNRAVKRHQTSDVPMIEGNLCISCLHQNTLTDRTLELYDKRKWLILVTALALNNER